MFGLWGWREVYMGFSNETFLNSRDLLSDHGIAFQTKVESGSGSPVTRGVNNSPATARAVGNPSGGAIYYLYVKKADAERATALLRGGGIVR